MLLDITCLVARVRNGSDSRYQAGCAVSATIIQFPSHNEMHAEMDAIKQLAFQFTLQQFERSGCLDKAPYRSEDLLFLIYGTNAHMFEKIAADLRRDQGQMNTKYKPRR
jgi:hypothetical protein